MKNRKYSKNIKINKATKFILLVFCLYLIIGIFNKNLTLKALSNTGQMLIKISPIFILIFIVMLIINVFLKIEKIKQHLGDDSNWKTWIYTIIAGVLISGPPYILFPMLKNLKDGGMKNSLIAIFLYNRNVKIPFIPVMIFYFGLPFTVIISIYIVIFSIFNGLLIGHWVKD